MRRHLSDPRPDRHPTRPTVALPPGDGFAMAEDWLVLSDRDPTAGLPALAESGLFVAEFALPLEGRCLLFDYKAHDGWERGLTLFHDPDSGLSLLHRQGRAVQRHSIAGPLPAVQGVGRLSLRFDAPARLWSLRLEVVDDPSVPVLTATGSNPLPMRPEDVAALSATPQRLQRHPALLWFGLARGAELPARAPWMGLRTPIETSRGPVAAGQLRPGDLVATVDHGLRPLAALHPLHLPACGSFAPVLLRAPYFPQRSDILVSSDQMVLLEGPEVEYLFGEDEILVPASALVDGRSAMAEQRRAVAPSVALIFEEPVIVLADGCALLSAVPGDVAPRRCLETYEAMTLMALLGRGGQRRRA